MVDPENREMMKDLYRLIEKYEIPLKTRYTDEMETYIKQVANECKAFYAKYACNEFAKELIFGFYTAIGERFQAENEMPLIDREEGK